MNSEKIKWIFEQHENINHMYDEYLPYSFHLRMVLRVAEKNIHLIPDSNNGEESFRDSIILASFGHDLLEDTHVSYGDVKNQLGFTAAEIIYAVTNEKGKNRKERANEKYYEGIRNTPGAVFVKLCDRIANVQYSKMTESRMFDMYKKENDEFMIRLGYTFNDSHEYSKLFVHLSKLFVD
jgi:(p)ppGpp synthase/HD superfamily hydrolase